MADRIKLLPEIVANQIKAGEVVESPSSAVKEMLENAIDAGASCVKVNFRNGGRDLIQIVDDGCGMSPTDARMAFECHATSKIATLDDIYALHTFGFRGEALASIAAVSQVELLTRQADAEVGTQTVVNGGEFVSQTPTATPVGSQFLVRNIFYNTPARRKFIDNNESKLAAGIKNEFRRVALCHPEVELHLYNNDSPIFMLPQSNLAERIVGVMGNSVKNNLLEVGVETTIAKIEGFVGKPSAAKLRSGEQYMFVNGRYFRSPYLNKAVVKAYEKLIPDGATPSFFIYLTVDAERVDVNVHAKKTEVKFADVEAVWQILNAAVRETLAKTGAVPMLDFDNESAIDIPIATRGIVYDEPRATTRENYNPFLKDVTADEFSIGSAIGSTVRTPASSYPSAGFGNAAADDDFDIPSAGGGSMDDEFEYIESGDSAEATMDFGGAERSVSDPVCFGKHYAMFTLDGRPMIADLARIHERILYDTYLSMLGHGSAVSQQLLFPEKLIVANDEYATMEEYAVDFAALGFDIEFMGDCTVEVRGIPADTTAERTDELIYEMIAALRTPQTADDMRRERLAATLARSAAGTKIAYTPQDANVLVAQLFASSNANYSPSGKQIIAELAMEEIKSKLG